MIENVLVFPPMTSSLAPIRGITISRSVIEETLQTMRSFGARGCEVLILWLGEIESDQGAARVVMALVPRQNAIASEDGVGYFVTGETLFHLNRGLSESGLRFIAQVHSHPTEAYHSDADDRYAIMTMDGGFSLVVPNFGHAPPDPASWAVYRLHQQDWRELTSAAVRALFTIRDP
jgi:hypothetical protein